MQSEKLINVNATRPQQATGTNGRSKGLQEIKLSEAVWPSESRQPWYERFLPHKESRLMSEQSKGGVFVPYPLLAILTPALFIMLSGLVTLIVMVRMQQADMDKQWQKIEQQDIYIRDDREKLIRLQEGMNSLLRDRSVEDAATKKRN